MVGNILRHSLIFLTKVDRPEEKPFEVEGHKHTYAHKYSLKAKMWKICINIYILFIDIITPGPLNFVFLKIEKKALQSNFEKMRLRGKRCFVSSVYNSSLHR